LIKAASSSEAVSLGYWGLFVASVSLLSSSYNPIEADSLLGMKFSKMLCKGFSESRISSSEASN
jgi:hypothetical protein